MTLTKMKFARLQAGLTQDDAAGKLGVSQSYLSLLENKQVIPNIALIQTMATLYDCEESDL